MVDGGNCYLIGIYDHKIEKSTKIRINVRNHIQCLIESVKLLTEAAKFTSIFEYEKVQNAKNLSEELSTLKVENSELKKENQLCFLATSLA